MSELVFKLDEEVCLQPITVVDWLEFDFKTLHDGKSKLNGAADLCHGGYCAVSIVTVDGKVEVGGTSGGCSEWKEMVISRGKNDITAF